MNQALPAGIPPPHLHTNTEIYQECTSRDTMERIEFAPPSSNVIAFFSHVVTRCISRNTEKRPRKLVTEGVNCGIHTKIPGPIGLPISLDEPGTRHKKLTSKFLEQSREDCLEIGSI
mmetsp:Transcript_3034/g.11661  ORF Transcript_3034/g.11661 Transcript_3034/m.11661 type:complete len:117 (+) Transcript_3034:720-1070(+)